MRLHFTLSQNSELVPFDYQHWLTGVFHKWLKQNNLHDKISLYSLAWLDGSKIVNNRLDFRTGAIWFVSFYEEEFAEKLVNGALKDPEVFCGIKVLSIKQQLTPNFGTKYAFKVGSPVLAKGKQGENGEPPTHYLYDNPIADEVLTKTLIRKMDEANKNAERIIFTDEDKKVKVSFDREYKYPKTKQASVRLLSKAQLKPCNLLGMLAWETEREAVLEV
jgi:CRISPR-associated endoribonuclease Cas6